MAKIKIGARGLSNVKKCAKGTEIITKGTGNVHAPGNEALLGEFATVNTKLLTVDGEVQALKTTLKEKQALLRTTVTEWHGAAGSLASFTESATKGVPEKVLSTGFDVRAAAQASQPVGQVQNLRVRLNGKEGYSKLTWKADPNAVTYFIESTETPGDPASWKRSATTTEAKATVNGATAGKKCSYRVAAFNSLGQGPWSDTAERPVM
jgi:hypothetical protein